MTSDTITAALEEIRATGPLTPSRVVGEAADPDHPLHPEFEWDDAKAGHEHRLAQARRLIAARVTRIEGTTRLLRTYLHVPTTAGVGEGEYLPIATVVTQPDMLTLSRDAAIRALAAAQDNIADLEEAVRLFGTRKASRRAARAGELVTVAQAELAGL